MTPEAAEEYTQSLGQIVAGSWRQIVWADTQGIPKALGMNTREWVEERLGGYIRLSIPQRQEAVAELSEEGVSTSVVADALGVDTATVNRDKAQMRRDEEATAHEQAEPSSEDSANARIEALPEDLAERVLSGTTPLHEAEHVVSEREKRVAKYVREVREALDLFERMVGHPVPTDLSKALTKDERKTLSMVLRALKEGVARVERVAA